MDPFVRKLIQRLHDPSRPLTRNRHFHTFDTPEGRFALKTSKRLKSLQRDILECLREGQRPTLLRQPEADGDQRIEIRMDRIGGRRTTVLSAAELELLRELPGVAQALTERSP